MFRYEDDEAVDHVRDHITDDRLSKYLAATDDNSRAIQLYAWNASASAALYFPLQALEIGFRNALHRCLSERFQPNWYEDDRFLKIAGSDEILVEVEKARARLRDLHKPDDPPHVVAELNFGFWTSLLDSSYEPSYWAMALWKAFPNYVAVRSKPVSRSKIADTFHHLRKLRNRIAHHEPIFDRDLAADYQNVLMACAWMYQDLRGWVEHHSTVATVLEQFGDLRLLKHKNVTS